VKLGIEERQIQWLNRGWRTSHPPRRPSSRWLAGLSAPKVPLGSICQGNRGLGMVMPVWVWIAIGGSLVVFFAFAWATK
jgi:hypothetical protein